MDFALTGQDVLVDVRVKEGPPKEVLRPCTLLFSIRCLAFAPLQPFINSSTNMRNQQWMHRWLIARVQFRNIDKMINGPSSELLQALREGWS